MEVPHSSLYLIDFVVIDNYELCGIFTLNIDSLC